MAREAYPPTTNLKNNAELPWAAAPGPYHFVRILDRGLNADRCLQRLEEVSPQTTNLKYIEH